MNLRLLIFIITSRDDTFFLEVDDSETLTCCTDAAFAARGA